jgi:hypothetical protein
MFVDVELMQAILLVAVVVRLLHREASADRF